MLYLVIPVLGITKLHYPCLYVFIRIRRMAPNKGYPTDLST